MDQIGGVLALVRVLFVCTRLSIVSLMHISRTVDTLHFVFCLYMMYWYLITQYGMIAELLRINWSVQVSLSLLKIL